MYRFLRCYFKESAFFFCFCKAMSLRAHKQMWPQLILFSVVIASGLCSLVYVSPAVGAVDDDKQIGFVWSSPSNAEGTVAYYRIYLSVDGEVFQLMEETTVDTYYVVPGDSGHSYKIRVAGVNAYDEEGPLSPESEEVLCLPEGGPLGERPLQYQLHQNYPNPFNAKTTLSYQNPEANRVVLAIFNVQGQKVRTLVDAFEAPGLHQVSWDGTDDIGTPVASGVYFCQMWCEDFLDVKKITVIR